MNIPAFAGMTDREAHASRASMTYQSDLLTTLTSRGYVHQMTDAAALDALAGKQIVPGYIGFDPTAPSLHVGSLVQIMLLRRLQQTGHKPIVLMGGGTGKIGDPSFKDEARKLLGEDGIKANVASIRRIFERFLTFGDGPTDAVMLDNAEWLDALEYIPFLRDVGQHFSVNRMLAFDSVKLRLDREQSLSFLEFNYMILQAYDFLELSRRAACRLQMGGSDQWGNIVNGIELSRRMDGTEVYGVTTPLITTADGGKMGKTGNSGATPTTATSAASCGCSPTCRSTKSRVLSRSKARRSTPPRSSSRTKQPRCAVAATPPNRPPRPRARRSRKARRAIRCRAWPFPVARSASSKPWSASASSPRTAKRAASWPRARCASMASPCASPRPPSPLRPPSGLASGRSDMGC
jgi:hypothetical protein